MESNITSATTETQDDIFFMNIIEENGISDDMLCNSLGCA